uniref:Transmembrane protein 88 a n=1 Tax=Hucho hucho TaxID=62062 RepID=A0A4W5MCW2_9TELE
VTSVPGSVAAATDAPLELRGSLDCWACSVLVTAQNLIIALVNSTLVSIVFGTIMTPALVMVVFGFLCHSTVRLQSRKKVCVYLLDDGGCVALLVVGFILVTPLLVLALAAYCRLARHQRGSSTLARGGQVLVDCPIPTTITSPHKLVGYQGYYLSGAIWQLSNVDSLIKVLITYSFQISTS